MSDLPNTHNGKIGGLPAQKREELCRRMYDGERSPTLLPWLNGLPEAQKVCRDQYDGEPINAQNLSNWRGGGYEKWLNEQKALRRTRERAAHSRALAEASGGNLSEGVIAQLTGELMDMLEEFTLLREAGGGLAADGEGGEGFDPKMLDSIAKALVAIRAKELEAQALLLKQKQVEQNAIALSLQQEKFELQYITKFIEHAGNQRAHEIATGTGTKEVKMDQLRELLFGRKPEAAAAA